jgi:LCP family protein required for cell wall assembly
MPGDGHDGPYLTDTIILASIKPSEQEVALISIPRDLIIPLEGYGLPKINSVNAIGEARNIGDGGNYATAAISKVFNIDIQYYVRIDFTGFRQAIDDIGGIEIDVETGFTDHMFPTNNHKTKTISFAQGQQVLDGARALQFARSRHGNNGENSDFARMKRQQKILKAMQNKIFSWRLFINLQTVQEALTSFSSHVATNLKVSELIRLGDLTYSAKNYISKSLDHNGNKLVSDGVGLDGASILQPSSGNYSNITIFINNIFE